MDLTFSEADRRFRQEVREFVADRLPAETRRKVRGGIRLSKAEMVAWQRLLYRQGWIAPAWPQAHGGPGWTPVQRYIFEEEMGLGAAPRLVPFGLVMVGPIIIEFGNDAQKARYLPRILASEDWWCQGYSEPGAGSDLASLRTSAVRDGDAYVVNGTKTWITYAQYADMIFCLVRTAQTPKKQDGISFLLIDMHSPGVTVRPITTIDGGDPEINEVIFENVRVPIENLIGEEHHGWTYAKFLLEHERTGSAGVAGATQQLARLREMAQHEFQNGAPLIDDPVFARKLAGVEIELTALKITTLRVLASEHAGASPGPESSILKIKGTELHQAITELMIEAAGEYRAPFMLADPDFAWDGTVTPYYLNWRKASIYAGSNEIQKNIIAKRILGL